MARYEMTIFDDSNNVIKVHNINDVSAPRIHEGVVIIHDLNGNYYGYKSWGRYTVSEVESD